MEKEYGGYLPIELNNGKEYYCGSEVMAFNCARSAIKYIIEMYQYKIIYLPFYLCESVSLSLQLYDLSIRFYHIDDKFVPQIKEIEDDAVILIANFYGIQTNIESLAEKYQAVIIDNTQAFFSQPVLRKGVYNVYSCRKFIGVCDGAYLISDSIKKTALVPFNPKYDEFLIKSMTYGTNAAYDINLLNEKQIESAGICAMSILSSRILSSVNYKNIREKRICNFNVMHKKLGKYNELRIKIDEKNIPMVYPLLVKNKDLRRRLVQANIYVPQWWKYILENKMANEYEKYLSEYLIPLPIDQRYCIEDMIDIARTVCLIIETEGEMISNDRKRVRTNKKY